MAVKTKQVSGRPILNFSSQQEVLDYVHELVKRPTRQLGNWSLGQICHHLAVAMDMAVDGASFTPAWIIRKLGPLLKTRVISRPMKPGFRLPKNAATLLPPPVSTEEGVAALETAVDRLAKTTERKRNVIFGPMTREEWNQLHLRHAEMHLSFIVPK